MVEQVAGLQPERGPVQCFVANEHAAYFVGHVEPFVQIKGETVGFLEGL